MASTKEPGSDKRDRASPGSPAGRAISASTNGLLRDCVHDAIEDFFAHLDGHPCQGLYAMVLAEVEAPLLESVMMHAQGNQRVAAEVLGISRGTLRKKLRDYSLV